MEVTVQEASLCTQRPHKDIHSPSATPVFTVLSLTGRAGNVKGDGDGVGGDGAGVLTVDGVVLHESARVVKEEEWVVDGHRHDVGIVFEGCVANRATNVYSNLDIHC